MSNKTKKVNPVIQKIGLSVLTVLIVIAIVFTTYYFTLNQEDSKYINALYKYKVEVDKSNDSVAEAVKSIDSLDIKNTSELSSIKSKLSKATTNLRDVAEGLQGVRPPSKYKDQYDNYQKGINMNKRIFQQVLLILKNPKSGDLKNAINTLSQDIVETSTAYEASKLKKAYIKLPDGILSMADKVNTYAFNVYKDYETRSQALEQYSTYFKSMDEIIGSFTTAKVDLSGNLGLLINNTISYDDVYTKIEGTINAITEIQGTYNSLSVPPKMGDRHNQLSSILSAYISYCIDFKIALNKFEESGGDLTPGSETAMGFEDLKNKYQTLSKNFTNFGDSYNNDKTKYSNADNL